MATDARVKSEQSEAEKSLVKSLGEDEAKTIIANRVKRDGDKAHITLANPQDGKKAVEYLAQQRGVSKSEAQKLIASLPLDGGWTAKGVGRAESGGKVAYFVVVDWPGGRAFRESLGLDPHGQDFHITVGFGDNGDVHGVPKNRVLPELSRAASLRSKVIRLAHLNPELRPHLLPLLTRTAGERVTVRDAKGVSYEVDADAARDALKNAVPRDRLSLLFPAFPKSTPSVLTPKEINLLSSEKLIQKPRVPRELSFREAEARYERLLNQAARETREGARGTGAGDDLGVWTDLAEGSYLTRKREFEVVLGILGVKSREAIRAIAERAAG